MKFPNFPSRPTANFTFSLPLPALASSIIICMHALHVITLHEALSHCGHGHDLTSVAQLSVCLTLEVLSLKHWHQSAFAKTLSMAQCSREASLGQASLLVYVRVASRNRTLGTLKRNGFSISAYALSLLHYSTKFGSSGHFRDEEIVAAKTNVRYRVGFANRIQNSL